MTFIDKSTLVPVLCNGSENCQPETDATQEVWRTLMAVYLGAILLLSVAFNSTICLVFYKKSHLLSISNCFVLNLACCQLCMSLLVLPFSLIAVVSHNLNYSGPWCQIQGFFSTVVIVTLQLNLLIISLDRNYAIMNSLRYNSVFTQRLCTILTSGSWVVGVIIAVPPLLKAGLAEYSFQRYQFICALNWNSNSGYLVVFSVLVFCMPILMESCCYIRIFMAAVSHTKRAARVYPSISVTRSSKFLRDPQSDSSESSDGTSSSNSKHEAAGCKAVRTIFLIALFYSVCWVPYFISCSLNAIHNVTLPHLSAASICLLYSSGILNPIIYVYLNRVIRREIGKFLCGTSSQNNSDDFVSTSMSTFSSVKQTAAAWSAHQRMRTRSAGVLGNDMDTIVEETEDAVVFETRSESDLQLVTTSDGKKDRDILGHSPGRTSTRSVRLADSTCITVSDRDRHVHTEECTYSCIQEIESKTATGDKGGESVRMGETSVNYNNALEVGLTKGKSVYANRTEGFVTAKTDSKTQVKHDPKHTVHPNKRMSRCNSFAYFSKGKRRKKRDCGSFLYFERDETLVRFQEARPYTDRDNISEKCRGQKRYSLDHRISVSSAPKVLKFRFSVTDIPDQINRVTVRSNVSLDEPCSTRSEARPSLSSESDSSGRNHEGIPERTPEEIPKGLQSHVVNMAE